MKAIMNTRFDNELSTVNESITRLHEQSLTKMRKLKRDLKAMKISEATHHEGEHNHKHNTTA
jgi:Skp family chaperone for outer membrane proteins